MSITRKFSGLPEILQKPLRYFLTAIRGQQVVISLAQKQVSVSLIRGWMTKQIVARFEEAQDPNALTDTVTPLITSAEVQLLRHILARIPANWRATPCHLVLADVGIQWGDIPWLGPTITLQERLALGRKRLATLYGESSERIIATESARFGHGQVIAALSRPWINGVRRVFQDEKLRLVSVVPAHTEAWNALIRRIKKQKKNGRQVPCDCLFATIERDGLTMSWQKRAAAVGKSVSLAPLNTIRGIRHFQCLADDTDDDVVMVATSDESAQVQLRSSMVRQIQRECVLQRLERPVVMVVLRKPLSAPDANSAVDLTSLKEVPPDWHIYEVSDWSKASIFDLHGLSSVGPREMPHRGHKANDTANQSDLTVSPSSSTSIRFCDLWNIQIEFLRDASTLTLSAWHRWVLGGAVACGCAAGVAFLQWDSQLVQNQQVLEQNSKERSENPKTASEKISILSSQQSEQQTRWMRVQSRLLRPWEDLFHCIETSTNSDITLLQIQPDAQTGDLHLTGDARTFKAIGKFVQSMQDHSILYGDVSKTSAHQIAATNLDRSATNGVPVCAKVGAPYLSSFQINEQDPQHPLHFEINAKWLIARPSDSTDSTGSASPKVSNLGGNP